MNATQPTMGIPTQAAGLSVVTEGLCFPEGPVALPNGDVLVVEIHAGALTRVTRDGAHHLIAAVGGGPNGAALGPDGRVYLCNNGGQTSAIQDGFRFPTFQLPDNYNGGSIQAVDLMTGHCETIYTHCGDIQLRAPNDLVFDAHGGMYFTDIGVLQDGRADIGRVFYARPDGSHIQCVLEGLIQPNGIGLSPEGDRLYVTETFTGRLWSWNVEGPGQLRGDSAFGGPAGGHFMYSSSGRVDFDSLAVDSEGNICVASMIRAGITVINPTGELVQFVPVPHERYVTNICFGGEGLRTAFITSSGTGRLMTMPWPRSGLALNFA